MNPRLIILCLFFACISSLHAQRISKSTYLGSETALGMAPDGKLYALPLDANGNLITSTGLATSSTATPITSSTSIVLTASTTQVRIIPAVTGTTYYMTGSGTAGATNAIPLTVGQITFDDTNAPGATISLSGSGALLIQQTR